MENWNSRRSVVIGTKGMCCSSQSLATSAGVKILDMGGTAADAAIAMAGVLSVVEPCSTGIGGDSFAIYYNADRDIENNVFSNRVRCFLGNGKSSELINLDLLARNKIGRYFKAMNNFRRRILCYLH